MTLARLWQNSAGTVRLQTAEAANSSNRTNTNSTVPAFALPEIDTHTHATATALSELGREQAKQGFLSSALLHFDRARALGLADPALLLRTVWTLLKAGRPERCVSIASDALKLYPDAAGIKNTLSLALREVGEFAAAEQVLLELLEAFPRFKSAHINLALLQFRQRNYLEGATHFEWRFAPVDDALFDVPLRWDEARVSGKRVLLQHEQGLGDTINFLRLADLVADLGAEVTALVQKPVLHLLKPAFPNITITTKARPSQFDFHAPLLCVIHRLALTPETIPKQRLPLAPDPVRVEFWRRELAHVAGLRVGVVHSGQPRHGRNRIRSLPPRAIAQWNAIPGVQIFDLHMRAPDRPGLRTWDQAGVINLGSGLDHGRAPFSDTMALLANLDLIITCDTSTAHLAGAMERPVWLALDAISDWRWHSSGSTSDWYETMRIYRQSQRGEWRPVMDKIANDLQAMVAKASAAAR